MLRTNKSYIGRRLKASEMMIEQFGEELLNNGLYDKYSSILEEGIDDGLLLSQYDIVKRNINNSYVRGKKIFFLRVVYKLRLGEFYRKLLSLFLWIKYSLLKSKF